MLFFHSQNMCYAIKGKATKTVLPVNLLFSNQILPPCSSTICFEMDKPKPKDCALAEPTRLIFVEPSKILWLIIFGIPIPWY